MLDKLLPLLLENGLLQFGRFERDGNVVPLLVNWDMLPAYPETLHYIVELVSSNIPVDVERLVCTADSVPLGVGVSLHSQIPLVYSRGKGQDPVHDLVGAYDVGHPALLLTNALSSATHTQQFITQAKKVGLHIQQVIAISDVGNAHADDAMKALIPFAEMLAWLEGRGQITQGQAQAVYGWHAKP
jgi:hypothetical protein